MVSQSELARQHGLVDQAARNLGLPSRQLLEELYDLREQVHSRFPACMIILGGLRSPPLAWTDGRFSIFGMMMDPSP